MSQREIVEKLELVVSLVSESVGLMVATGVCSAMVMFIVAMMVGVALFKCAWRRREYFRFLRRHDSRADITMVGFSRIYRPPESRHALPIGSPNALLRPKRNFAQKYFRADHEVAIDFSWVLPGPTGYQPGRHLSPTTFDRV